MALHGYIRVSKTNGRSGDRTNAHANHSNRNRPDAPPEVESRQVPSVKEQHTHNTEDEKERDQGQRRIKHQHTESQPKQKQRQQPGCAEAAVGRLSQHGEERGERQQPQQRKWRTFFG